MSDLVHTLAAAFRRKGSDRMPATELPLLLAFGLHWFAPADAKRFVERAIAGGFLARDNEDLVLAFDRDAVDIPLNFRPTANVLDAPFPAMPPRRAAKALPEAPPTHAPAPAPAPASPPNPSPSGAPAGDGDKAAEREFTKRSGLMTLDVARLVAARRAGADVTERLEAVERTLLGRPS